MKTINLVIELILREIDLSGIINIPLLEQQLIIKMKKLIEDYKLSIVSHEILIKSSIGRPRMINYPGNEIRVCIRWYEKEEDGKIRRKVAERDIHSSYSCIEDGLKLIEETENGTNGILF